MLGITADATGFGVWSSVYSGLDTYYEDRGRLQLYTTYVYRLSVFNTFGQTTSNFSAEVTTFGGVPTVAANVSVRSVNHTAVEVNWTTPGALSWLNLQISS